MSAGDPTSTPRTGAARAPRPTVALCLSGSIAAFKAVEVARRLREAGVRVLPVMTEAATRFLGPATLHALCAEPVQVDLFAPSAAGELHVEITAAADVVALVPATADLLEAVAHGRATDLVRAVALCARGRLVVAPAMHPRMWSHQATQRNVELLRADGRVELVGPVEGRVASGEVGLGRMADPETIAAAILAALAPGDLQGLHLVVSAGPTVEDLDPVRFLSNRSSGKMGFALAERAAARGARVTLVAGPVALATPPRVERVAVRSAADMRAALWQAMGADLQAADGLIMAAAVADYRAASRSETKLERGVGGARLGLELVANPDLLGEIGAARTGRRPLLVGFALETGTAEAMLERARAKLEHKRVDLMVANGAAEALDQDSNRVTLVTRAASTALDPLPKTRVADRILDWVAKSCRT
jgi:phosphopantothenoylcysteine decarboxylase/phosphopantothenate--cysteine ligase